MRTVLVIFGVLTAFANVFGQAEIKVPKGKPAMVDGRAEPGEWSDAYVEHLPGDVRLYAKRSDEFLWLAIELPEGGDGAVDLYVSPASGEIDDLHASAKLGERRLERGKWPDWQWWNNRAWTANVSRVDSFDKRSFLPTRVREYQIRLDRPCVESDVRIAYPGRTCVEDYSLSCRSEQLEPEGLVDACFWIKSN